jgi:Xaa-Pro aminopeptidase
MNNYLANFCNSVIGNSKLNIDAFLVSNQTNMQYLSGFTGHDTFLLVLANKSFLITDFRYIQQAHEEIKDKSIKIIRHKNGLFNKVCKIVNTYKKKIRHLGFESPSITVSSFKELKKNLNKHIKLIPTQDKIEKIRAIKTPEEIDKIKQAIKCASDAFTKIRKYIKPGLSERVIANELDYQMRKKGAINSSFPSIVAIDERAALPHAPVSSKILSPQSAVLIDWGARVSEYNSDTTRVLFFGKIPEKTRTIYQIVLEAQERAINKVKPGEVIKNIDFSARNFIKQKGYAKFFGHGLGHGIGRMGHELPRLRQKNKEVIKHGMVFTIEPGIYLPGKIGIRLEDMVLVTENGYDVLTKSIPKELYQMVIY